MVTAFVVFFLVFALSQPFAWFVLGSFLFHLCFVSYMVLSLLSCCFMLFGRFDSSATSLKLNCSFLTGSLRLIMIVY